MPLQYTGIVGEHQNVRTAVGVTTSPTMGEILVTGSKAQDFPIM